jgi:predicted NACHT family NTPase
MEIIKNNNIKLKVIKSDIDDLDADLEKIDEPLCKKSGAYYIVGRPGSGKTSLWLSLLLTKNNGYYRKFDKIYLINK